MIYLILSYIYKITIMLLINERKLMLQLDEHLRYQVNHFHGSLFDFIYKCHEVLEHNKVINSFYTQACEVSNTYKSMPQIKNKMLAAIANDTITMIDRHDIDLAEHLNEWLTRIKDLNNLKD